MRPVFIFFILISLLSFESVFSAILCKDSKIDSIAFANDLRMYFISIGGYYWWVKDNKFPIKEENAKKLPAPFTKATAAVYIDGDSGCAVQSRSGMRAVEKMIWITDIIDGQIKLMAYDVKLGKWSANPINYDENKCIAKARMNFTSGQPIDAIFTRNYLEVYLVQGTKYAMVDCKFLCSNPDGSEFGSDSRPYPTTDFGTQDPINGMYTIDSKKLVMFHDKQYYVMSIDERYSENGKLKANKAGSPKDVLNDFLKLKDLPDECDGEGPQPPAPEPDNTEDTNSESPENGDKDSDSDVAPDLDDGTKPKNDDSSGLIWIIVAIVAIALIAIVGLLVFFAIKICCKVKVKVKIEDKRSSKITSIPTIVTIDSSDDFFTKQIHMDRIDPTDRTYFYNEVLKQSPETENFEIADSDPLGKGGFGEVYKIIDIKTSKYYAIKVMKIVKGEEGERDRTRLRQFKREITILTKIKHRNIIELFGHFLVENESFMIMELATEGDLKTRLRRKCRHEDRGFDESEAKRYFIQISNAINIIHKLGFVHGDLKLENVLITKTNDREVIKVTDFGCSRVAYDEEYHSASGTVNYMSPEQLGVYLAKNLDSPELIKHGNSYNPQKADVWSLGICLYRMIANKSPLKYEKSSVKSLRVEAINDMLSNMKDGIDLPEHVSETITDECWDMLSSLLEYNKHSRIQMDGVMRHPWIINDPDLDKP